MNFTRISVFFQSFVKGQSGSTLPFIALALPAIFGVVGLGTDASLWMFQKRNLQIAADNAVLAAGWELAQNSPDNMDDAAARQALKMVMKPTRMES